MDFDYIIRSLLTPINTVMSSLFSWTFSLFYGWDTMPMIIVTTTTVVGMIYSLIWIIDRVSVK